MRNWNAATYGETVLNPIALIFTLIMCITILVINRKYLYAPLLFTLLFIPYIQRIVILGLDFDMLRIVMIFGIIRIIVKRETQDIKLNKPDKIYLLWVILTVIMFILRLKTFGAFVNRLGFGLNAISIYFLMRTSIKDEEDIIFIFKILLLLSIPIALSMINEVITGRNMFFIFGGVPEFTTIRDGRLRCQASFPHPILTGAFGATIIPAAWALWNIKKSQLISVLGFISGMIIVFLSASSGPILSLAGGFIALFCWYLRKHMQIVRRIIFWGLIALHFIMKGPVWSLLWRVSIVSGSTGYHRYNLIDQFIRRFREWALWGVNSTAGWGWGLQDVTNYFVRVGVDGGFLSFFLFVYMIVLCFKRVGNLLKLPDSKGNQFLKWSLASILFIQIVSFFGVSYFGNMSFFYYSIVAIIFSFQFHINTWNKGSKNSVPLKT